VSPAATLASRTADRSLSGGGGVGQACASNNRSLARRRPLLAIVAVAGPLAAGAACAHQAVEGIALVVGVIVITAVLVRPAVGAYLLAAIVPITAGWQRGFPVPGLNLSEVAIAAIGGLLIAMAPRHARLRWKAFEWLLLAFCLGWLGLGLVNSWALGVSLSVSDLETLLGPFQFFILYRAMVTSLRAPRERVVAVTSLLVASLPVDVLVYLQQARIPAINQFISRMTGGSVFESYAYHYFARATGPFPHWTPLAGYLIVVLLTAVGCVLYQVQLPLPRGALGGLLLAAAVSLAFTAELSAIAGALIGSVLLAVWAGRSRQAVWAMVVVTAAVGVVAGPYLFQRLSDQFASSAGVARSTLIPQTLAYRWQVWTTQYLPAIGQRPLTGWGLTLPSSISWPFSESQYVTDLMAGGVPLLAVFGGELAAFYALCRGLRQRSMLTGSVTTAMLAGTVAALVLVLVPMNVVYPYLTSAGMPAPLFIVAGIAVAGATWNAPEPRLGGTELTGAPYPVARARLHRRARAPLQVRAQNGARGDR